MVDENKNEAFFKNIASMYVQQDGERLRQEMETMEKDHYGDTTPGLDRKINRTLRKNKWQSFYWVAATAACVFIAFFSMNLFSVSKQVPNSNTATTPAPQDIIQLSAKLPTGYFLTNIDYDQGKTIYFIENDTNNPIVLTVEENSEKINTSEMQQIDIQGTAVYALLKKDFNFMTFEKDHMVYTLTSKYEYQDLVTLSKNLL